MDLRFVCVHVNSELHGMRVEGKNAVWQAKFQQDATMDDPVNSGAITLSGNGQCPVSVGQVFDVSILPEAE